MFGENHHQNGEAENRHERTPQKGIDFLVGSSKPKMGLAEGYPSRPQELTLSYLCENNSSKIETLPSQKGKQVIPSDPVEKWVERDFLSLSENKSSSSPSKRDSPQVDVEEEEDKGGNFGRDKKKPKLEVTLNLSLALPEVSTTNLGVDPVVKSRPCRSVQSLDCVGGFPSNTNPNDYNDTNMTCSNDITVSYSYSHPFSHNPSCSLTRNSENYDYSVGKDDQIWCGGEGTNGSVHSRFRPIGDGIVALNNGNNGGGNGGLGLKQCNRVGKDSCNDSLLRTTSSDNVSFFPSELPAKLRLDTCSRDSRKRESENLRGFEVEDGGRGKKLSRQERILREIVSESIPVMAQIFQELPEETLESTKEYLRNLIWMPEKRDELVGLQNRLDRRSDLTKEALFKCQKDQLEILVALKMGLGSFVSGKIRVPANELVEIFLFMRCRNVNCKSILPVDDCDCKFCLGNKGFCSSCMCPICMKFDCANNTCSWVGCDVCSHWCHATCGLQKDLIRPGPSLNGPAGTTEVQFHCIGCNHASEMFGFVKDVFVSCAKDWGLETLIKELACVRNIFQGSEDPRGKQLHMKADELLGKLESKIISASDGCDIVIQYFNNGTSYLHASTASEELMPPVASSFRKEAVPSLPVPPASLPPKYSVYNTSSLSGRRDPMLVDLQRKDLKAALLGGLKIEEEFQFGKLSKKDAYDSLESLVRIKEAEARMFQSKADEAQREADGYRRMICVKSEKLEQEYAGKLSKLCLQETEERRMKKLEELKVLENSHCDYYNMKLRMQAEIAGLLERMKATKQKWV